MHEHERVDAALCNQPRGNNGFPECGRGREDACLVFQHCDGCELLLGPQLAPESHLQRLAVAALVAHDRTDTQVRQGLANVLQTAARNADVMRMLLELGPTATAERVEDVVRAKLARKEKIPGFGHRVYRTEDPRATHLRRMSRDLGKRGGVTAWYDMSERLEALVKGEKKLNPNVDFYSASTYYTLGIPIDLYTPIIAVSRISGWTAHILEQYANNRLIRPRADYVGPTYPQRFVPVEQR